MLRRLAVIALLCALGLGLIGAVGAPPAGAHTEVLRAEPGPGAAVAPGVSEVSLTFLDPVLPGVVIEVADATGTAVPAEGAVTLSEDRRRAALPIRPLVEPGAYVVRYEFVATDGDRQADTYRFVIEEPGEGRGRIVVGAGLVALVAAGGIVVSLRRRRTPAST